MNPINELIQAHRDALAYFEKNSAGRIQEIAESIIRMIDLGGILYLCGNGGSAADAQHIAGEFVGRFKRNRKPLPAVALTTDTSVISCIGNDYGYRDVFSRQVEALMKPNDLLWTFSASGASENVISAVKSAKKKGNFVVGFTGKQGSVLESLADLTLCAHAELTSTAQEIHQLAYHIICAVIDDYKPGSCTG